jgi:hypothetical protein
MPHRCLLALDLGVTTGYAVFTKDAALIDHGTISDDFIVRELNRLLTTFLISRTVAEMPLLIGRGQLQKRLEKVIAAPRSIFRAALTEVDPASWKQTPYYKATVPRGLTQHERDAIRLGMWYMQTWLKTL